MLCSQLSSKKWTVQDQWGKNNLICLFLFTLTDIFNPNDFDAIETSPQMYYLQVEGQNIVDSPVDSQAIPLNMLLNVSNEFLYLCIILYS